MTDGRVKIFQDLGLLTVGAYTYAKKNCEILYCNGLRLAAPGHLQPASSLSLDRQFAATSSLSFRLLYFTYVVANRYISFCLALLNRVGLHSYIIVK